MNDFDYTISRLESMAGSFAYCESERLREMGLHRIKFSKHRYLLGYRLD